MQYIRAPKQGEGRCPLCDYVSEAPSSDSAVLAQWERSYVVLNRYPYAAGHLLVVPKVHSRELDSLPEADYAEVFRLVRAATARLRAATGADGINIGINLGVAAGAGIEAHLHVHVVPRFEGDNNFMPVLTDVRVLPEYVSDTWEFLAPHFQSLQDGSR